MIVLNERALKEGIEQRGFPSVKAFAGHLGLHRNTVHNYLSGKPVISDALNKIAEFLDLGPAELFLRKVEEHADQLEALAPLIDQLAQAAANTCLVLFGSRARKSARRSSDFDIGVFSSEGIPHESFRKLRILKSDLEEKSPVSIDLINLNSATSEFIREISGDWQFLAGRRTEWCNLKKHAES